MAGPDTKNPETPYPIWGFGPPSPEPDTKKLDALLASLNGSAERFQTLWFSFLGLTLYLAIAALATTHRNLLLGEPQVLPILNIKVELLPFYVIAPLLYLVFHFYLLMMLALLARTAAEFDKQLRTTLPAEPERERYRAQVGNALFLQLLVGMKGERTGINALLMGLIALITIVLAPLATLVLMQMMFLPYHHLRITWWHRVVVVADLVLIVVMTYRCFFPCGVMKAPLVLGALNPPIRWAAAMGFCIVLAISLVPLVNWLSFNQGRWAGEPKASSWQVWVQWMEGKLPPPPEVLPDYATTEKGIVFGLFPDRLDLHDETIVGEKTFEETKKEIASRGGEFVPTMNLDKRDLQAANLSRADLRGVSMNEAWLLGANLESARLDYARISCNREGEDIVCAKLQGANLRFSQIQGAYVMGANMQGADLNGASGQGAVLVAVQLQGADLTGVHLEGFNLDYAQMQGAYLLSAHLQGAGLDSAQLQGADLAYTRLQGAVFNSAQLQGANLTGSRLDETEILDSFVGMTRIDNADLSTCAIRLVHPGPVTASDGIMTPSDLKGWIAAATQFAPKDRAAGIVEQFARLKPDFLADPRQPTWPGLEEAAARLDPDGAGHRRQLATLLVNLACAADGSPYIARGLMGWPNAGLPSRFVALGDQLDGARKRMKDGRDKPDACKGVAGFTEDDWRRLDAIKPD